MNTNKIKIILACIVCTGFVFSQNLPIHLSATVVADSSYSHAKSLSEIHDGEKWGWHSGALGKTIVSSKLKSNEKLTYGASNLSDLDLRTAWVEGVDGYGIGEKITITINDSYIPNTITFNGKFEIFNGYCKDEKTWKENSRVKKLKICHNDKIMFTIDLHDTWQLQTFDIWPYITHHSNRNGFLTLKKDDIITVSIEDVFKGSKYKDTAISEFVTPSLVADRFIIG